MSDLLASAADYGGGSGATAVAYRTVSCDTIPAQPTVEQAHGIMQRHLACPTQTCRHRQAALNVLVAAGRYALP